MKKTALKNEWDLIHEFKNGKYREMHLIYDRKSLDETNSQKNSLLYQKSENLRFAQREGLSVAKISIKGFCTDGVISEKHSGFKEDDALSFTEDGLVQYRIERPKFQKLLLLLNRGYVKGVICLCWDRISRNKGDDVIIRKLMRRGVDIRFTYANYDKTSAGALHMDIDGMFSQHHSRVTSEKVILATRNNREKGICTYRAPIGYLNSGKMEHKPFDLERAPIIKELFELYASGGWSLSDLARYANEQGMTTVPTRRRRTKEELLDEEFDPKNLPKVARPITENNVSRILSNYFYTGRIKGNDGLYIKSVSHKALVDDTLFNKVQAMLKKKYVSIQYTEKLDLPLRGIMRCSQCQRSFTPYIKKGIQYYSSRCKKDCKNTFRNFNLEYITNAIGNEMHTLCFSEKEMFEMDKRGRTHLALLKEKKNKKLIQMERKKRKAQEDLTYLTNNKLSLLRSGVYTPKTYYEEERKLSRKLLDFQCFEQSSNTDMYEIIQDVQKLSELLKNVTTLYNLAKVSEKEQIIRSIFSELYISENTLEYIVHTGFECLNGQTSPICAPYACISELYEKQEKIKASIQDLESIITASTTKR